MKYCLILLILLLPLHAEKVTFETNYSVEFPEGWKKPKKDGEGALVYRGSGAGDASFAIAKLELPKNARADLKGTLSAMIEGFKKGMKVIGEPKMTEGAVDGKKAIFARVFVKTEGHKMGFFLVAVDAGERVFIMEATLPASASNKSRADCMKIIQSFKETS